MNAASDNLLADAAFPGEAQARVGASLRAAREARELGVAEVAQALKLHPRQVEALESDRFDLLPGRAFARGFLKNYARFLDLDAGPLLQAVDQAAGSGAMELAPVSNAQGTMPSPDERFRPSAAPAALLALALLVVVAAGWYFDWFQQPPVVVEDIPPPREAEAVPPPALAVVPVPAPVAETPSVSTAGTPPAAPAAASAPLAAAPDSTPAAPPADAVPAGQHSLVFRFGEDAWIEVRDGSGRIILSRIGKAGSAEEVQGSPPFSLVVGNAASVVLEHNGQKVDLAPHTRVTVARLKLE